MTTRLKCNLGYYGDRGKKQPQAFCTERKYFSFPPSSSTPFTNTTHSNTVAIPFRCYAVSVVDNIKIRISL